MTRQYQRYDREQLTELVKQSTSFTDVCRKLNKKPVGGSITNMRLMCDRWEIDHSHMTKQAHNKGKRSFNRKSPDDILVMGSPTDHRMAPARIRHHLFEVGFKYECNCCGITEWNGKPLVLEIDHIDGQYWNNTRENLQFLCPNCHAQKTSTPT